MTSATRPPLAKHAYHGERISGEKFLISIWCSEDDFDPLIVRVSVPTDGGTNVLIPEVFFDSLMPAELEVILNDLPPQLAVNLVGWIRLKNVLDDPPSPENII